MKSPTMTCPHCKGCGRVPLDPASMETLAVLSKKQFISSIEVFHKIKGAYLREPTAANNRLTKLQELGFVVSERRGKSLFWKRVK